MLVLMSSTALGFVPFSNETYGGKYSEYVPTFVTSRNMVKDTTFSTGFNSTDSNFRVQIPHFITNPFTNENVADNNTLFAISIAFDPLINALPSCNASFSDTLNERIWIIDREGGNWFYPLNETSTWVTDQSTIFFFEATNFEPTLDSYSELVDITLSYETFCPTIKIWGFRKLSWSEVEIGNDEARASSISEIADTIFGYAINIVQINYKLWLIAYWIIQILLVLGAVSFIISIPFFVIKQFKRQ